MSKISLSPDANGTGIFTIASPNSNTNRTLTLPDDTGTIVTNSGNQAGSFTTLNTSGAVVFNDAGADVDFRVEGDTDANLLFVDASTDRMGIGTSSPPEKLSVIQGSGTTTRAIVGGGSQALLVINGDRDNSGDAGEEDSALLLATDGVYDNSVNNGLGTYGFRIGAINDGGSTGVKFTEARDNVDIERMRIDSSGNLLVGTTSSSDISGVGFKLGANATTPWVTQTVDTSNAGAGTYHLYNVNATNNGYRFYVRSNGGISNYSGNNVNLSDERTKTNIELAGSYLDKVCAIPVKLFNYKDEAEGEQKTLGVIAQDVESVAPEFVNQDGWLGNPPEGESPLKSIYTTDMMFGLMKCIQELKAELDEAKARIAALETGA